MMYSIPTYTVLLADDHASYRQSLRGAIEKHVQFKVIDEASDGREAIALAYQHQPQLILLDLRMPEVHGTEAIGAIKRRLPTCKIIILTGHADAEYLRLALQRGADGYLLKEDELSFIRECMRLVMEGYRPVSPRLAHHLIDSLLAPHSLALDSMAQLTDKEREVLRLTAERKTAQTIADKLDMSRRTAEDIRRRIRKKIGHRDLEQYAREHGLI